MIMAFVITNDILAPRGNIIIEYNGPDPFSVYKQLDPKMRVLFEGVGSNIFEPDFRWDTSENPHSFFFIVYIERRLDKYTKFRVQVRGQGLQPTDTTKNGSIRLEISGNITTEIKSTTFKDRVAYPLILAYMYSFYNSVRRKYLEMLRGRVEEFEKEIREFLKIPVRA